MMQPTGSPTRRSPRTIRPPGGAAGSDAFGRIVQIVRDNNRLLSELSAMNRRIGDARAYLARPDCRLALALANLGHLKSKQSGLLALLRANRIEASLFLGSAVAGAPTPRAAE